MLLLGLGLVLAFPAQADIYKYVDKHGRVILTDQPTNDKYKRLVKTWKGWVEQKSRIATEDFLRNRTRFAPTINRYADIHQLPHALLPAMGELLEVFVQFVWKVDQQLFHSTTPI